MDETNNSDITPTNLSEKSEKPVQYFRELLWNGSVEAALKWENEMRLNREEIMTHVYDAFESHKDMNQYKTALEIGKCFGLKPESIESILAAQWKHLINDKQYEEAAKWAFDNGLPDIELKRAAILAYEDYIKSGKTGEALDVITTYNLTKEDLLGFTITEFNNAFNRGNYYHAAMLGREFKFSEKRTNIAAINAVFKDIKEYNFKRVANIIYQFSLFTDKAFNTIPESDARKFCETITADFIQAGLRKNNLQIIRQFATENKIFDQGYRNVILQQFVQDFYLSLVKAHNDFLRSSNQDAAQFIIKSFMLLSRPLPHNLTVMLIGESLKYHKELLKINNINDAVAFRNEYMLFSKFELENSAEEALNEAVEYVASAIEKGDFPSAKFAITEYKIPQKLVENSIFEAIFIMMEKRKYKDAINILHQFELKITSDEVKRRIETVYRGMINDNEYIFAAELAKSMKLGRKFVEDAVNRAWLEKFTARSFEPAFEIKEQYKLPKKYTYETARMAYWDFFDKNDYDTAVYIRKSYGVSISITQWLIEFFKILFKKSN